MIHAALIAAIIAAPASQGLIDASLDSFRAGDYDAALIGFEKAFEASPERPRLLWNIGRCLEELGRTDEALQRFERYLEIEADDSRGIRDALTKVAKLRAAAEPKSATLRVETSPPRATVVVDGEVVGPAPVLLDVPEGEHVIAARMEGRLPAETRVSATAGQAAVISLVLPEVPPEAPSAGLRPGLSPPPGPRQGWIAPAAIGVAGVLLTALAVQAFLDSGEHEDSAATARRHGASGELRDEAATALASDSDGRATFHSALAWSLSTTAAAALGWAGWAALAARPSAGLPASAP